MSTNEIDPGTSGSSDIPVSAGTRNVSPKHRVALVSGVIAVLLTWSAGEAVVEWFRPTRGANRAIHMTWQQQQEELEQVQVLNGVLAVGLQGAVLGLVLGAAGGIARGSMGVAAPVSLGGVLLGGGLGALAAWGAFTCKIHFKDGDRSELISSLLAHEGAWIPVGAGVGLAFGLGLGGRGTAWRALVGGLLGAAAGAVVYEILGVAAFPLSHTTNPVASSAVPRLFAHAAIGFGTVLGVVSVATETTRKSASRTAVDVP